MYKRRKLNIPRRRRTVRKPMRRRSYIKRQIVSVLNRRTETKFKTVYLIDRLMKNSINASITSQRLNSDHYFNLNFHPLQGTGFDERIGDQVTPIKAWLKFRCMFFNNGSSQLSLYAMKLRVIVFALGDRDVTTANIDDFFNGGSRDSMIASVNRSRVRVVYDKIRTVPSPKNAGGSLTSACWADMMININFKMPGSFKGRPIHYDSELTAKPKDARNQLYCAIFSSTAGISSTMTDLQQTGYIHGLMRLYYKD